MIQYRVTNNGLKFYLEEPWIMPNIQQKNPEKGPKNPKRDPENPEIMIEKLADTLFYSCEYCCFLHCLVVFSFFIDILWSQLSQRG